ncbi:hypothetical protein [Flavobacterium sp. J27]|uniref:hypothetical protein n=1 Tax=Flavobacterium sp. J27 TaxID=2060419 RepID=UPI001031FBDA|nr:hypothetical protein [Flavobacterium sp. J27]
MSAISINSQNFYINLEKDRLSNYPVFTDFEVIIDNIIVTWQYRIIKNVTFKERVIIRDCEINSGIKFSNCKFEKGVIFYNVKSTNYDSTYNAQNESVCFENSEATLIAFENNCFLDRSLTFKKECKIEKLDITNFENRNAGISIRNSNVNYLSISNSKTKINLSNSIFQKSTRFETIIGDVSFVKNEFQEDIMIWNLECPFGLTLNYNLFKDRFKVDASRIKALTIFGDTFEKKAEFENRDTSPNNLNINTYLNKIYISQAKFNEGIDFNGLGKSLDELDLVITPELKGVLNFDNWIVEKAIISGINQNLKLLFKNIKFRFLFINDFTNFSDISFDRCKGNGNEAILNLINSDLGSTRFNEFDLKSFKILRLNNVSIDKIRASNVNWFEDNQVEIEVDQQTESEKAKRKREIYRQLKQALKNQGNQIDSLIFQARELRCLRGEFKKSEKYSFGERVIMMVSQSNNYGLNWLKPVLITFFTTLSLYMIIVPGFSDEILFSPSFTKQDFWFTYEIYSNKLVTFWNLFNPVRRYDLTYGEKIQTNWIYFLDLIHRIFLGIMIFQIIKAFRKYVSN